MRHYIVFLIATLLTTMPVVAQKTHLSDKKNNYYKQGKVFYQEKKYDNAINTFKKAKSIAFNSNDTINIMNALYRIGLCYLAKEDYKIAQQYFIQTLTLEITNGDSLRIAKGYNNVGITKHYLSELDSCLFYYKKALNIYKATSNKKLPQFIKNIGIVYKRKGDYKNASEYLFESAQLFENQNKKEESASIYNIIGSMYNQSGYDSLSLRYHKLALTIREELKNTTVIAESLNNLANVVRRTHGTDSSLTIYRRALKITENTNSKRLRSKILNNIGEVYLGWRNYKKSKDFFTSSLTLKKELGDQYGIAHTSLNIAKILLQEKKFDEAEKLIQNGLVISEKINALNLLVQYHGIYSQLLTTNRKFEKATQYYKLYSNLKDSLLNEFKVKSLSDAEVKYKTSDLKKQVAFLEPLEGEIEILNLKTENQNEKLKFQTTINWSLSFGVLAILIFTVLLWKLGKQRKKNNELLELKNEEITHRIKNNLEILTGVFSGQSRMINDEKVKSILVQNQYRLKAINHLHNRLSKEPNTTISAKIYFEGLIDDLLFSLNFSKKDCLLSIDELQINTDTILHIGLLMNELITNAVKHGLKDSKKPLLEVVLKNNNSYTKLIVKDNGLGLVNTIDMEQTKSYGMTLINKLVKRQLEGTLLYSYEKGAIFTIKIPI